MIIPNIVLQQAKVSETQFRQELALFRFHREVFTLGQASELAGLDQTSFQRYYRPTG